jgi:endonuclease I
MISRIALNVTFLVITLSAFTQIPTGYYDSANGLSGDALKSELNNIIDGHTELSYDAAKEALKVTDEDTLNSNNVICLYSGWSYAKTEFGNGSEQWNREHTWSKSHGDFGDVPPAGTDIHHLRPTDASVNSAKNNRDFDYGVDQYIDGSGPTQCYTDTDIWEPRDEVKGDVARMIFYMATRYEGENGEVDLEIVDYVNTAGSTNEPYYGKLSTLLVWHANDPVDSWEQNRNDIIYYSYQGNRNPYIDHPEYLNMIWGSINPEPSNHVTGFAVSSITPTSLTLIWNDNDGTDPADKFLLMINTTGTFTSPVDGTEQSDDTDISDNEGRVNVSHGVQTYTFTGLTDNTTYYFEIYPYSNFGIDIDYKTDGTIPTASGLTNVSNVYLIISEVADPGDNYQARFIELYNSGNYSIDFDSETWYLCRQANATSWGVVQLTGTILSGETFTICYNQTNYLNEFGKNADMSSGYVSGNGNDGYFLYSGGDNTTGTLIDSYGVQDVDGTNEPWEYLDSRAVRKYSDSIPSQTWQSDQWIIKSANTTDMSPDWHHKDISWTGSTSQAWETSDNWNIESTTSEYIPDAGSRVIIPQTSNSPVINSEASCDLIEILSNATLQLNSGTLTIGH